MFVNLRLGGSEKVKVKRLTELAYGTSPNIFISVSESGGKMLKIREFFFCQKINLELEVKGFE